MACGQEKPVKFAFEHKFARDIISFILRDHMTGLHWIPNGMFEGTDVDSPFTPQLRHAVKEELEYYGHKLHKVFDEYFPDKSIIDDKFMEVCRNAKEKFVSEDVKIKSFISFSTLLAVFAGLSYHYGGTTGPYISYMLIVQAVRSLKELGKIDDNFWNEMQNWLENNTAS